MILYLIEFPIKNMGYWYILYIMPVEMHFKSFDTIIKFDI